MADAPKLDPLDEPSRMARLRADLQTIYQSSAVVPDQMDETLRAEFASHFQRQQQAAKRGGSWRFAGWLAAAATIALAVWLVTPSVRGPRTAMVSQSQPADVDHNGRIDILDAFALARRIEAHESIRPG